MTLILAAMVYLRGWLRLRRSHPEVAATGWVAAFLGGLVAVWVAVGSPLVVFDDGLLTIHMVQHVLLMTVAPPLLLLGSPGLPLLHGMPQGLVFRFLAPSMRAPIVRKAERILTNPFVCWLSAALALLAWHVPALFELALSSQMLHELEHASFFATGLLFWWPVIRPWPQLADRQRRWGAPLYLFLATLPCDALSAFLAFCGRVIYPSYLAEPRPFGISALLDQQTAAAFMWFSATFIYLVPAVIITVQLLSPAPPVPLTQIPETPEARPEGAPQLPACQDWHG